ncbi:hypothetical protein GW17_00058884 [Ensete ventricosum]|nr:hypothetical protein GW17_00058884 [Ensete ventricosum]
MRRTFICIRLILHVMNKTSRLPLDFDHICSVLIYKRSTAPLSLLLQQQQHQSSWIYSNRSTASSRQ